MDQYEIPAQLVGDEGEVLMMVCVPNSPGWITAVKSVIYLLTRGRHWHRDTGSIIGAQAIGKEIFESMSTCSLDLLIEKVELIATTIGALNLSVTNNITVDPATVENTVNVPSPEVTVFNQVKCLCGCGGGGGDTPSDPGEEGGTPPIGWGEPTDPTGTPTTPGSPAYIDRKCKIANIIQDQFRESIMRMKETEVLGLNAETWFSIFGAAYSAVVGAMIGAILGEAATPFPLVDGVVGGVSGFIQGLVKAIGEDGVDFDVILAAMDNRRDDLVCALYSSTGAIEAQNNYVSVMSEESIGLGNEGVVRAFLVVDLINILWWNKEEIQTQLEQALDGYVAPSPCSTCLSTEILFPFDIDLEGWELTEDPGQLNFSPILDNTGQTLVWDAGAGDGSLILTAQPTLAALCRSPQFAVMLSANSVLEWDAATNINATWEITAEIGGAFQNLYSEGTGTPEEQDIIDLSAFAGQVMTRIWLLVEGTSGGEKIMSVKFIDVKEIV